jgi:hypothetical protein
MLGFKWKEETMRLIRQASSFLLMVGILFMGSTASSDEPKTLLVHLKTGLKHGDAQICVAYNTIWAALEDGLDVNVVIDADAVNIYRIGWFGKDRIENDKLPDSMRRDLARQLKVPQEKIPNRYGDYLVMLRDKGAEFYINEEMLITAGISKEPGDLERISAKFFKPVSLSEMLRLRLEADTYLVY